MVPNDACRAQKEVVENGLGFSALLIPPAGRAICRFLDPVAGNDGEVLEGEFGGVDKVVFGHQVHVLDALNGEVDLGRAGSAIAVGPRADDGPVHPAHVAHGGRFGESSVASKALV